MSELARMIREINQTAERLADTVASAASPHLHPKLKAELMNVVRRLRGAPGRHLPARFRMLRSVKADVETHLQRFEAGKVYDTAKFYYMEMYLPDWLADGTAEEA